MLKTLLTRAALIATAVATTAAAYEVTALDGDAMVVVAATSLRTEPGPDNPVVAPLKVGETVKVWASAYVTVRAETTEGGEPYVIERNELWYKVRTDDGYEGWAPASGFDFPPESSSTP